MNKKIYRVLTIAIVLTFIVPAVTFAAWYNPVDWFRAIIGIFHKEEIVLIPATNISNSTSTPNNKDKIAVSLSGRIQVKGRVGFGEIMLKNGGAGFIYITYIDNTGRKETVNLFKLKNSNLREGEEVIVYYNPNNFEDIIVYDSQNKLIYDNTKKIATSTLDTVAASTTIQEAGKEVIEIILDASGSMAGMLDGEQKINIAKKAIEMVVNDTAEDSIIGLRVYGSEGKYEDKNCKDTRLLFPISKLNKSAYISSAKSFSPSGWTPIDYVLRLSKDDFKNYINNPKKIVLVSDGEETCGGDPCQAIKDLKKEGFNVVVDTIGFNVDLKAKEQLKCITTASGGVYYDAINIGQLEKILRIIVPKVPTPAKIIVPKVPEPQKISW